MRFPAIASPMFHRSPAAHCQDRSWSPPATVDLLCGERFETLQLAACVRQPIYDVRLIPAGTDQILEPFDLVDERSTTRFERFVLIRIHDDARYRATVTQRGAPTRAGRGEWAPDQRGHANTHPRSDSPRNDAPTAQKGLCGR